MQFFERTVGCGLVNQDFLGKIIQLTGWVYRRRDHGGLIFIDLRDRSGVMQIVFNPESAKDVHALAHSLRSEFVIAVTGKVVERGRHCKAWADGRRLKGGVGAGRCAAGSMQRPNWDHVLRRGARRGSGWSKSGPHPRARGS